MKLKLVERIEEVANVITFVFEPQEAIVWSGGQYLHYVLHHEPTDDRGSDRWFTNSAAPYEKVVRITTRITPETGSSFKKKLTGLVIGKNIEISFVEGDFVVEDPTLEYVFLAGGIGVTPYRSIIKQLDFEKKPINVTLIYANRDENIVFKSELEEIAKRNPNFQIHYVISPQRIDENKIREVVKDINKPFFYVSGPEPMVDSLTEVLKNMGISEEKIKGDWFPNYPDY